MSRALTGIGYGSDLVRGQRAYTKDDVLKAKFLLRLVFIIAFLAILSLVFIWCRVQVVQYGYDINALLSKKYELVEENRRLQTEIMTLQAPQRIEKIAIDQLKMVHPTAHQLRSLP